MSFRVDLILPVYNEKENFSDFYTYISTHLSSDWKLLVVYDFPEDTTLSVAMPIAQKDARVRMITNEGKGVLGAIKTGFDRSEAEALLVVMVDDPREVLGKIDEMTRVFYEKNAAIVSASRYMPGGKRSGGPKVKSLLTYLASTTLRYLIRFPIHDATYNTKIYRKSFLESIVIESARGFEVALEVTVKAYLAGKSLLEVPVEWSERTIGTSRFNVMKLVPGYLRWYLYGIREYYTPNFLKKSANPSRTI